MTQIVFLEWLKAFDLRMANRKVLLIMDNCSAHVLLAELPDRIQLRNTTVFYLPPNTTSKLQPCDAGIIRNLKAYYRRSFNRLLWQHMEDNVANPDKMDILQAIRLVVPAWKDEVKPATIANCFGHCRIRSVGHVLARDQQLPVAAAEDVVAEEDLLDQEVIKDLESQIRQFRYRNPMDIRNLLNYPDEEVVSYLPDLDDIIREHLPVETDNATVDEDDSEELPPIPAAEADRIIHSLETFWMQQADTEDHFMTSLQRMRDKVRAIRTRQVVQKDIQSYFMRA